MILDCHVMKRMRDIWCLEQRPHVLPSGGWRRPRFAGYRTFCPQRRVPEVTEADAGWSRSGGAEAPERRDQPASAEVTGGTRSKAKRSVSKAKRGRLQPERSKTCGLCGDSFFRKGYRTFCRLTIEKPIQVF